MVLLSNRYLFILILCVGLLFSVAFVYIPFFLVIVFAPFYAVIEHFIELRKRAWTKVIILSFSFGMLIVLVGSYGIVNSMMLYGGISFTYAHASFFLLCLFMCIKLPINIAISFFIRYRFRVNPFIVYPMVWLICDIFIPQYFPWYIGASFADYPLCIQVADLIGSHGISAVIIFINIGFMYVFRYIFWKKPFPVYRCCAAIILPILLSVGYGFYRLSENASPDKNFLDVGMIQANLEMRKQRKETLGQRLEIIHSMTERAIYATPNMPDLIIWPESTIWHRFDNPELDGETNSATLPTEVLINRLQDKFAVPLLYGGGLIEKWSDDYSRNSLARYNAVSLKFPGTSPSLFYRKRGLVAFGEGIPFKLSWPWLHHRLRTLYGLFGFPVDETSSFSPGSEGGIFPLSTKTNGSWLIMPLICYETLFTSLAYESIEAAEASSYSGYNRVFVEQTNTKWFGDTMIIPLHHFSALMRAVEFRIPMIRATNSGISEIIDSYGRIIHQERELDTTAVIRAHVPSHAQVKTVYQRFGKDALIACILILILSCIVSHFWRRNA